MDVVFALVGVSIVLVIVIAIVLMWAVRSGQFEDMEGPAWRVVMDDDRPGSGNAAQSEPEIEPRESPLPDAPQDATIDTRRETPDVKAREHE
jgi:cbb3-type cytochrome oxidase maturation protein